MLQEKKNHEHKRRNPLCSSLSSLSKHLPTLETLVLNNCESLEFDLGNRNKNGEREDEDDTRGFGSLWHLIFCKLSKLEILPKWLLQGPTTSNTTLVSLFISECDNFRALWEEGESLSLTSLNTLEIEDCPCFC